MGGCVRLIILMVKQTGKRKGMRESSSSVPTFFEWACRLFVCSFFFWIFRRAKAGDNVLPRGGAKSRKKKKTSFFPRSCRLRGKRFRAVSEKRARIERERAHRKLREWKNGRKLPFFPAPFPSYISFHFSGGENPVPLLCSENKWKRLLRRLLSLSVQGSAHFVFRSLEKREK